MGVDVCHRWVQLALVVLFVLILTGWQPRSRAREPPREVAAWYCSCVGVPMNSRPVEIILQRRSFLPDAPTKPEPGCGPVRRSVEPSAHAAALRALLSARLDVSPCSRDTTIHDVPLGGTIATEMAGRQRALGPLIHALVPLIWHAALHTIPNASSATRTRILAPVLRGLLSASANSHAAARGPEVGLVDAKAVTLGAYLQTLSSATAESCVLATRRPRRRPTSRSKPQLPPLTMTLRRDLTEPTSYEYAARGAMALPPAWRPYGLFWLVAHTIAHLLSRPSSRLRHRIDLHKRLLHLGAPGRSTSNPKASRRTSGAGGGEGARNGGTLGVHIRRSDSCMPYTVFGRRRSCDPLASYTPHVHRLAARYGYTQVYLVADSVGVIDNASAAFAPLRVLVRSDARDAARRAHAAREADAKAVAALRARRRSTAATPRGEIHNASTQVASLPDMLYEESLHGGGRMDGDERVLDFLVDVHLLGECDGIVGKFSSHLSRAAYALMAVRGGVDCLRPYVSLDVPWCFGLGCRKQGDEMLKSLWRAAARAQRHARVQAAVPPPPAPGGREDVPVLMTPHTGTASVSLWTDHASARELAQRVRAFHDQ